MKTLLMKPQFILLSLLLLVSACNNGETEEVRQNSNINATPVYVEELKPATFRHYVTVLGDVESDKTIMITPKVTATVEEILVRAGDDVKKGAILAKLDGKITRSQLQEAKSQFELAQTLYERQKNLSSQNIGSEVELLQSKTQYESAKNSLATLTEQYENYTISASISGTLNMVNLKVGETVGPGTAVFQLANSEALKVRAEISEAYITRIDQTDSAEIVFPSLGETITKKVDVVSKVINASNRTFGVEIYIPEANANIRPNMMARVKINDVVLRNQIVVPVNTIQKANNKSHVFVAIETDKGWTAAQREVTTAQSYNNDIVIREGLEYGDLLIITGYADLSDGQPIAIQEEN